MSSFIDKDYLYAIIGASKKKNKFGYKVLMDLAQKGFRAVPVNPKYEDIDGIKCYASLLELDDRPDVVIVITQPEISFKIIEECANLDLEKIWFQPGAADEAVIKLAQERGLNIMVDQCIMKETDNLGE